MAGTHLHPLPLLPQGRLQLCFAATPCKCLPVHTDMLRLQVSKPSSVGDRHAHPEAGQAEYS